MSVLASSTNLILWRIVIIVMGVITSVILARFLGPQDRGIYAIVVATLTLLTLVAQFGIPEAAIIVLGTNEFNRNDVLSTLIIWVAVVSIFASLATLVFCLSDPRISTMSSFGLALASACVVSSSLLRHLLLSLNAISYYSFSVAAETLALLGYLTVGVYSSGTGMLEDAIQAYSFATICGMLVALVLAVFSYRGDFAFTRFNTKILKSCFKHGGHLFPMGLSGFFAQRLSFFVLEIFGGAREVGLYAVASTIPNLLANFPRQIATVIFVQTAHSSDKTDTFQVAVSTFRWVVVLQGTALIFLLPVSSFLCVVLFGDEYAGLGLTMSILIVATVCIGLNAVLFNALAGTGSTEIGRRATFLSIGVLAFGLVLLVPKLNTEGAAVAQAFSTFSGLVYVVRSFLQKSQARLSSLLPNADTWADARRFLSRKRRKDESNL